MQIKNVIIKVDDQDKALAFYTGTLGLAKCRDIPGDIRWLTVSSPEEAGGAELVLEPNHFPPARASQQTLYEAGFPAAILTTTDIDTEYRRLKDMGVRFRGEPQDIGRVKFAFFDDTCGNWIVLSQLQDQ
jgi:catechol 2,3-dioxygenase-like lactoylglutathione lyase family enzyme